MEKNTKTLASVQNTVSTAVIEYNKCASGLSDVFNMLDIRDGYYFELHATSPSMKRCLDASRHANETSNKKRLMRKRFKQGYEDQHTAMKGVLYEAGGFNTYKCFINITSLYCMFRTYCMIVVTVQQIYNHYLAIIYIMCYWFIHKEDGVYFPNHFFFIVALSEHCRIIN